MKILTSGEKDKKIWETIVKGSPERVMPILVLMAEETGERQ